MLLLYNNQFIPEDALKLPLHNRAFQYNDGFFETAMVVNGEVRFWPDHVNRMQEAAQALRLNLPPYFLTKLFEEKLLKLASENETDAHGRLKIKVWRAGAGLYSPQTNDVEWYATIQPAPLMKEDSLKVEVSQRIRTFFSPLSHFKGPNSISYVMASMEKQEHGCDDMLLLDTQNHVSELTSSNIFWVKNDVLYTPSLKTGCINGIMRRNIFRWCKAEGVRVEEVQGSVDALLQSDSVFAANVTGLRHICALNGRLLKPETSFLEKLRRMMNRYR